MSAGVQDSLVSTACSAQFCQQGFAWTFHVSYVLLAPHYEVIDLIVKSGA